MPLADVADGVTIIMDCPLGVTICGGAVVKVELPPPHPAATSTSLNTTRKMIALNDLEDAKCRGCAGECRFAPISSDRSRMAARTRPVSVGRIGNGVRRGTSENGSMTLAVPLVVTDTMNGAAFPFAICIVDGP